MHPELKALVAACRDPADTAARLVLADWLDEHGEPHTAYALRWMVRHDRDPHREAAGWRWYRRGVDDAFSSNPRVRRIPVARRWLPAVVGDRMSADHSPDWLTAVKKLGRAIARVKEMVDL